MRRARRCAPGCAHGHTLSGRFTGTGAIALVSFAFLVNMVGTTLPTPLYPLYELQYGISPTAITLIFAVYAVGVTAALLVAGRFSDTIGRRTMLLPALALSGASAVLFLAANDVALLYAGRVLSGLSAGIFTGTATAMLIAGCVWLLGGLVLLAIALASESLALLIASAVTAGIGQGLCMGAGLAELSARAPESRRGEVASTYFFVVYIGLIIPVIGDGLLSSALGLREAGIIFTAAIGALVLGVTATLIMQRS